MEKFYRAIISWDNGHSNGTRKRIIKAPSRDVAIEECNLDPSFEKLDSISLILWTDDENSPII